MNFHRRAAVHGSGPAPSGVTSQLTEDQQRKAKLRAYYSKKSVKRAGSGGPSQTSTTSAATTMGKKEGDQGLHPGADHSNFGRLVLYLTTVHVSTKKDLVVSFELEGVVKSATVDKSEMDSLYEVGFVN
eukprot:sb/3475275/